MDIRNFDTRKRAEAGIQTPLKVEGVTIRGSDGAPVLFTIKGTDSPLVRDYLKKLSDDEGKAKSQEDIAERDIEFALNLCTGWTDNASASPAEGEPEQPFPFNAENAAYMFSVPAIREALIAVAMDRKNFMTGF